MLKIRFVALIIILVACLFDEKINSRVSLFFPKLQKIIKCKDINAQLKRKNL